ncbi:phospholipase-like protein [Tanacetum coccineum]
MKNTFILVNNMNIVSQMLVTRVRERTQLISEHDNCHGSTIAFESAKLLREINEVDLVKARDFMTAISHIQIKESNLIFDLRPTLAEYQSEWFYRNISMAISNVHRSKISSLKDCDIKELNSRIFKLEAIIQILSQDRNGGVVDKLEFSDEDPLDANIEEGFDEDYLLEEEFRMRLEDEERLLLEEERLIKKEKRVRLEEQKRLLIEEERALKVKKGWDEDYRKRSYTFMNSDHKKQAMTRCTPKKRSEFVPVRTGSWLQDLSQINIAIDNIWISKDLDIYLGQPGHLRSWTEADKVFIPINEPTQHWCLAEFDILSGVVTFYDSGDRYSLLV